MDANVEIQDVESHCMKLKYERQWMKSPTARALEDLPEKQLPAVIP